MIEPRSRSPIAVPRSLPNTHPSAVYSGLGQLNMDEQVANVVVEMAVESSMAVVAGARCSTSPATTYAGPCI